MSVEAEMSVLGCMMLDEESAKTAIDALAPEMFSHPTLKMIFDTATGLYWERSKIDAVTLMGKIPGHKNTILKLAAYVPTTSHLQEYMQIVIDDWRRRGIKSSLLAAVAEADTKTADETTNFLREIVKKQDAVFKLQHDGGASFHDAAQEFMDWLKATGDPDTVRAGYGSLDYALGGFLKTSVTALCARAGHGKTDFALNLAIRMAKRGYKVQYFTMEMPKLQLMQRIVSQLTHIDGTNIRDKKLSFDEIEETSAILDAFEHESKMNFVDEAKVSTKTIRHYVDLYKPDIIFIDHLGLMERPNIKDQYHALGMVSNELKQIAKEKNIAIIELVQMNRQIEGRKDKTPNLGDIRESGDIEQDADYVMFVQSEDIADRQLSGDAWADATVYLLKNRHGRPGKFQFHWQPQYHTFIEVENNF